MTNAKHTQGPCLVERVKTSCGYCLKIGTAEQLATKARRHKEIPAYACIYVDYDNGGHEAIANATLIAEAFNVAHETGKTPRQLQADIAAVQLLADQRALDCEDFKEERDNIEAQNKELLEALENQQRGLNAITDNAKSWTAEQTMKHAQGLSLYISEVIAKARGEA